MPASELLMRLVHGTERWHGVAEPIAVLQASSGPPP